MAAFSTTKYLYFLPDHDPLTNLVLEELLFENLKPGQEIYLVYINSPCVVIGRHQNPWKETKPALLQKRGIPLLRRISGGGTVWHDLGNINFCWMGPKHVYHRDVVDGWVRLTLASFGISFDISNKGDYLYKGAKFSGNAFAFRSDRAMHHGTLLVSSHIQTLEEFMGGIQIVHSLGVPSRPAVVMNLVEINSRLDVGSLAAALIDQLGIRPSPLPQFDDFAELFRARGGREWILGQTPRFHVVTKNHRIIEVIHGKIDEDYFSEEIVL